MEKIVRKYFPLIFSYKNFLVMILVIYFGTAEAHRRRDGITEIFVNPKTKLLEISHRFYLLDVEDVFHHLEDEEGHGLGKEKLEEVLHKFMAHFSLSQKPTKPWALQWVGYELSGEFLWIYQEYHMPAEKLDLQVEISQWGDQWPSKNHRIDFIRNADERTSFYLNQKTKKVTIHP